MNDKMRIVGASFVACTALHHATKWILLSTRKGQRLTHKDVLYMAELVPSTIHAICMAVGSAWLIGRGSFDKDLVEEYPKECDLLLLGSVGYALSDTLVMVRHGDALPMYAHHVVMGTGSYMMARRRRGAFFPLFFFMSEITVPVQNAVFFGQKWGWSMKTMAALMLLRAAVFVVFRLGLAPAMVAFCRSRGLDPVRSLKRLGEPASTISILNLATLTSLNVYWTIAVVKKAKPIAQWLCR